MQKHAEPHKAPQMLGNSRPAFLNGENRSIRSDSAGHVRGVEATPEGLIRSTLKAGGVAAALLLVFYLPSEYGTDYTGLGGVLGLTEMGEIKQQLYAEQAADEAAAANAAVIPTEMVNRLDRMERQLAAIAAVYGADILATLPASAQPMTAPAAPDSAPAATMPDTRDAAPAASSPVPAVVGWRDEASFSLAPGEGIEVKLVMQEGQTARFEWTANGAVVNYDTHGDGGGNSISYEKGRSVPDQAGELTAAFTGNHGWFWRNRTDAPVTLTVRTAGDYAEMKSP